MDFLLELVNTDKLLSIIKDFFILFTTYHIATKIIDSEIFEKGAKIKSLIILIVSIFFYSYIKEKVQFIYGIVFLILLLAINMNKAIHINMSKSIIIVIISLSINSIFLVFAIIISFIFNSILDIELNIIRLSSILIIYQILIYAFLRRKKFKNGFSFLQRNIQNDYFNILILNISMVILFVFIIMSNYERKLTLNFLIGFIVFSIIMFITIQKSLQLYYKQKLLEQELNETKDELEKKKEEVKQLEAENLNFSKTSHTLAHKQKSLEYKLEQLKQKYEIAEEIEIEDRIKDISKEIYNKTPEVEISKTGILEIDDMLKYMQSECIKNNIEFRLQIKGNIYEMINNYISKEDLSILIADHVKNAIIAINHSENINKSILVRLGKINKIYSLYIYDSGIEFEKETLSNLGKIPSTTHADNGGTGMGFMNTFDTLRKYNASLIINEYNKPSNDNYTKSIVIKLDRRNEFTINSYKDKINN